MTKQSKALLLHHTIHPKTSEVAGFPPPAVKILRQHKPAKLLHHLAIKLKTELPTNNLLTWMTGTL
jgi:hypothetical protein